MLREGFGEISYVISVVGGNTYSTYTKMGARIHRTVALRMCLLMYIIVKYIGRWLYVVITTKHKIARCVVLANEFYKKTHVDK